MAKKKDTLKLLIRKFSNIFYLKSGRVGVSLDLIDKMFKCQFMALAVKN